MAFAGTVFGASCLVTHIAGQTSGNSVKGGELIRNPNHREGSLAMCAVVKTALPSHADTHEGRKKQRPCASE